MQMAWDMISTWIKYEEKFYVIPSTGHIINKPFAAWTSQHQQIAQAMDYVECVNLSMQVSVFFLLQCFWNYLSNSVAKKSFMSSREFKFYIFWALGSVAIFPVLQWYFREDPGLRETVPQLAFAVEMIITSALGIRSDLRFKRILKLSGNLKNSGVVIEKLTYFKDMNIYLTFVLFMYGVCLSILCIDGLTVAKTINSNKFAADLLIANCNTAAILMWLVGFSIFHPRRSNDDETTSANSNGMSRTAVTMSRGNMDIESSHSNKFKHGSSFTEGNKVNDQRLSQRITNFIENKNAAAATAARFNDKYNPSSEELQNSRSGSFLRPMGPVEVDYPTGTSGTSRTFTPTHQFSPSSPTAEKTNFSRSIAVDDPYTNSPINFTMMDPKSVSGKRYNQPASVAGRESYERSVSPMSGTSGARTQDYPMQTMSGAISNPNDFRFDPLLEENTYDYLATPTRARTNDHSQEWLGQTPNSGRI
ncbi:hypothetical protein INT47_013204 [Mucor saturninus]|uniref:Uncharacterized protein n=1 Tax=Mucor saturninus TaxID=64648 RepID=A0A8H7V4E8_9FUNG|nr:hypothetical protein INT47_013204 [Mucor saturninus]